MRIQYYGTGDGYGIPEPFCSCRLCTYAREHGGKDVRTRSQAVIDDLMIDCSVDLLAHTLFYGLDMRKYPNILITHGHGDHFAAGDFTSRYRSDQTWHLYLPPRLADREAENYQRILRSNDKTPPRRCPELHRVEPFRPFSIGDYRITALPARHMAEGESLVYCITHNGKTAAWLHDTGELLPEVRAYLKSSPLHFDFVSMDCTLERGSHFTPNHMDILQCAETADFLKSIGCADSGTVFVLSHIGHLIDRTHEELCREAESFGFRVAYDTMEIEI